MKKQLLFRYALLALIFLSLIILGFGIFFWQQTEVNLSDKNQDSNNTSELAISQIGEGSIPAVFTEEEDDIITSSSTLDDSVEPEKEVEATTSATVTDEQLTRLFQDYQRLFVENNRELLAKRVTYPLDTPCALAAAFGEEWVEDQSNPKFIIDTEEKFLENFDGLFNSNEKYLIMNIDIEKEATDESYEFSTVTEYGTEALSLSPHDVSLAPSSVSMSIYTVTDISEDEGSKHLNFKITPEGEYDTGYLHLEYISCTG